MSEENWGLAERQLARQVASEIIRAMGEGDVSLERMDEVLQAGSGYMRDKLLSLIEGRGGTTVKTLGEIAWAVDRVPVLSLIPMELEEAPDDNSEEGTSQSVETPTG